MRSPVCIFEILRKSVLWRVTVYKICYSSANAAEKSFVSIIYILCNTSCQYQQVCKQSINFTYSEFTAVHNVNMPS